MTSLRKNVLKPLHKRMLYAVILLLWISGVVWLYLRYFVQIQGEYGPEAHPAQAMLLKLHGAVAMIFLIVFGSILYHIRPGWKTKSQRPSGVSLLTTCIVLILTGWGLYYIGHEKIRYLSSAIHSILGFFLPVIIFLHVWNVRHHPH